MPELKNKRHEAFAKQLASGQNIQSAYASVGYAVHHQNAYRLASKDAVKERVAELKNQPTEIEKTNGRDPDSGRFLTGNGGGGRPKGSRNKLGEAFIADLHHQWQKSGVAALERVAKDDPVQFVRVVAGVLPREIDATLTIDSELFAEARNFAQAFRMARDYIGADADTPLIEASAEEVVDEL